MNSIEITVLLSVYNGGNYLKNCLISIVNQSFRNFEFIIIDDGSTDNSLEIIDEFSKNDSRIKVISRENRGLVLSLNEGIELSSGRWIVRMDADDISYPWRLERQLKYVLENHLDICGSFIKTFGFCIPRIKKYYIECDDILTQLYFNTAFAHPTIMVKREVLIENLYLKKWEKIEDYELWTRLASAGYKMGNFPEVLLMYRKSYGQITNRHRDLQDRLRSDIAIQYAESRPLNSIPNSIFLIYHDRTGNLTCDQFMDVFECLLNYISSGNSESHVVLANLRLFVIRNLYCVGSFDSIGMRSVFSKKERLILKIISLLPKYQWNGFVNVVRALF